MKILDITGKEKGSIELPEQFKETVRPDVIKRAVEVIEANNVQPYGAKPGAGMRASAELSRRRHNYRGSYGHGISRVPRKILTRRGTRMNWVAAVAPGTVGGRKAHPPKSQKILTKSINEKERKMAIRSALAATADKEYVASRGHKVPDAYPFAVADEFEHVAKTKDIKKALEAVGLKDELSRTATRKVRAGKGTSRGRKYKTKK